MTSAFPKEAPTRDATCPASLTEAVQRYFDLMYDCDTSRFADVFAATVQLHGYRDGQMVCWRADVYRDILHKRASPKSAWLSNRRPVMGFDSRHRS